MLLNICLFIRNNVLTFFDGLNESLIEVASSLSLTWMLPENHDYKVIFCINCESNIFTFGPTSLQNCILISYEFNFNNQFNSFDISILEERKFKDSQESDSNAIFKGFVCIVVHIRAALFDKVNKYFEHKLSNLLWLVNLIP